jgi:tetratricopeptide (TPR) repeat protein
MSGVKRVLLALILLGIGLAAAYGLFETRRARTFRQLVDRGEAALAAGDSVAAVEDFSGAVALRPNAMLGYLRRGDAYRHRREYDAALRDLTRATTLDPTSTRARELKGDIERALLRYDRAAETYRAYLDIDDQSPRILYKLALSSFHLGRAGDAVDALNRAIELDERQAEYHYLLGLCLSETGSPAAGRAALQRAVVLDPTFLLAREELAAAYERAGDRARQVEQLEALLALDPRPGRAAALASAQAGRGQLERAVTTLRTASDRFPDAAEIYAALGQVWLAHARVDADDVSIAKARQALERAVAAAPDSATLLALGRLQRLQGDLASAERTLQQAVSDRPVAPEALSELVVVADRLGHAAIARRALLDHVALIGEPAGADDRAALAGRLGALSAAAGEPDVAAVWYRRAADEDPASATWLGALADAELRQGNRDAARQAAIRATALDPRNPAALRVLRQVR